MQDDIKYNPSSATTAIGASQAEGANLAPPSDTLAITARALTVEARKKNGAPLVEEILRSAVLTAKMNARAELLRGENAFRTDLLREAGRRVVCGFIAEVDQVMGKGHGMPPQMVWAVNSFTVAKIVDALNAAGYHSSGFRDPVSR